MIFYDYWRSSSAWRVRIALGWKAISFERRVVNLGAREQDAPGFRALNPLGQVPALILPDGTVMTESAAIAIHLADLHPQLRLAPAKNSPERALYLRWMIYLAANIYVSDLRIYHPERISADPAHGDAIKAFYIVQGQNGTWQTKARGCSGASGC